MNKQTLLLTALLLLLSTAVFSQQPIIVLLEAPLHRSEKETVQFLQSLTSGKEPVMVVDGKFRSYSLEGPSFHMEYKIAGDTCVAAMLRIQSNSGLYNRTVQQIFASTKPFGPNHLKQTTGGLLLYELHSAESSIIAVSYGYALKNLRKQGY